MKYLKILFLLIFALSVFNFTLAQEESEEVILEEEIELSNLVQNGDFESRDISPWEVVLINIKDSNYYEAEIFIDYFMWVRRNSR
ncbi:MAG: hypothetical protein ACK4SU_05530, partial [Dictyoglomus sp.]